MRFNYLEPATIQEAIALLGKHGEKARVIAGGTDLLVKTRAKAIKPEYVIDISYIPKLDYIAYDEKQGLRIGALTTIRAVETSDKIRKFYPAISQAAGLVGSVAIRNVATIGGNLCNAAPSADIIPSLIGFSAKAKIIGADGERETPVENFCSGPGFTCLRKAELLAEIQVPVPPTGTKGVYLKHTRTPIDLALVGVAVILILDSDEVCKDIKIVLGAVAPTPIRAKKAEEILRGKKIESALIEKAAQTASSEARPISDVRASAEYRREIIEVLTRRAIKQLTAK